ncbi:hypothetical protein NTG1052_450031 [Candidatus Nitrotoga sp. 1052]|nr:hypothetical protein NTG1052_450031 [Candidatus Nitrotoga sp. 1052]
MNCRWTKLSPCIDMDKSNSEQTQMLVNGIEVLIGVLGNIVMGIGQEKH